MLHVSFKREFKLFCCLIKVKHPLTSIAIYTRSERETLSNKTFFLKCVIFLVKAV